MAGKKYKGRRRDRQRTPLQTKIARKLTTPPEPWWQPFTGDRHEDLTRSWTRS